MDGYLKERRLQLNLTLKEVAAKVGVSEATVSRWEGGQIANMKRQYIAAYAAALQTTPGFIMTGKEEQETDTTRRAVSIPPGFLPPPKMKKVPLIGDIACGDPITAEQNVADYLDVPEDVQCDFCLRCHGDSMIDAHIQDGDVVYIHCQPEVNDGEIAAVRIGDEATLKRVYYDGQSLTLMPCNSAYRPRTYSGPELNEIHIEGRMVGFMHHGSR